MSLPRVNLVVVGHKDHGKSTLIGRLLCDSKAILSKKIEEIKDELARSGRKFELAHILDSLEEERKGGLTIDIVQTPFRSKKYLYTIIDCPGHREFVKKMLTGASQADASVLVLSASEGIEDQTRQHAFLTRKLGITQLVVAVNKMDAVAYNEAAFTQLCCELDEKILHPLKLQEIPIVPVSALHGDNVYDRSEKMKWYDGSPLIDTLDGCVIPPAPAVDKPLRGFVQDVYRRNSEEIAVCKVEAGMVRLGSAVHFSPSGKEGRVRMIESFGAKLEKAGPGDSVGLVVEAVRGLERGEVVSCSEARPPLAKAFTAEIVLFSDAEVRLGDLLTVRYGTAERKCQVEEIISEIDPISLVTRTEHPISLQPGSVSEVRFRSLEKFPLERYSDFPQLGRFVVAGRKGAVAAGIVVDLKSDRAYSCITSLTRRGVQQID